MVYDKWFADSEPFPVDVKHDHISFIHKFRNLSWMLGCSKMYIDSIVQARYPRSVSKDTSVLCSSTSVYYKFRSRPEWSDILSLKMIQDSLRKLSDQYWSLSYKEDSSSLGYQDVICNYRNDTCISIQIQWDRRRTARHQSKSGRVKEIIQYISDGTNVQLLTDSTGVALPKTGVYIVEGVRCVYLYQDRDKFQVVFGNVNQSLDCFYWISL